MKKFIAWILVLALLCVPLSACGKQESVTSSGGQESIPSGSGAEQLSPEELDEVTHRLLADWYGYLIRCEYLYGDEVWALSYLDPFFESHSWDDLQTARAALCLAELRAKRIDPPEAAQMSFEDYDKLIQSGADVSAAQLAFDSISSLINSQLLEYRSYRNSLNSPGEEFFLTYQLTHFENWAGIMRQICEVHLRSCAIETDYLLLEVDNEEDEARFIEAITEKCPQINAWRAINPQDQNALQKDMADLLDELERLTDELSANVGQSKAILDLVKDEPELDVNGGMDALAQYVAAISANVVELIGFPTALPYPDWWYEQEDQEFLYTWEDAEGNKQPSAMPGDTIETPPNQYYVEWPDVSLEEYHAYLKVLEAYTISAKFTTEKEGTHTAFYQLQTGSFALIWEDNNAEFITTEGSVCFAPPWYVDYSRLTAP